MAWRRVHRHCPMTRPDGQRRPRLFLPYHRGHLLGLLETFLRRQLLWVPVGVEESRNGWGEWWQSS
jgi:hypothetical protein